MSTNIQRFSQGTSQIDIPPLVQNFYHHGQHYYENLSENVRWMHRRVLQISSFLPRSAALITYHLWKATPYIAANIFLPGLLYITGVVAVTAYKIMLTPTNTTPNLVSIQNGVGFSEIVVGAGNLIYGLATYDAISLIRGIFQAVIGTLFLYKSGFVNKMREIVSPS